MARRHFGRAIGLVAVACAVLLLFGPPPADARKRRARTGTTAPGPHTVSSAPTTTLHRASSPNRFEPLPTITRPPDGAPAASAAASTSAKTAASTSAHLAPPILSDSRSDPRLARIGFRNQQKLHDHFAKHGAEFGVINEATYLEMAQALRDAPRSRRILETVQANGTISRFDRQTGAFMAFDTDLTIRTFFRPDDGEAYFRRAAQRSR